MEIFSKYKKYQFAVAKPTPLPDRLGTEKVDLFEELVPVAIHQVILLSF